MKNFSPGKFPCVWCVTGGWIEQGREAAKTKNPTLSTLFRLLALSEWGSLNSLASRTSQKKKIMYKRGVNELRMYEKGQNREQRRRLTCCT